MQDNGGTRSGNDRRKFQYTAHIPEKRSDRDRRKGFDRRSSIARRRGSERRVSLNHRELGGGPKKLDNVLSSESIRI